MNILVTGANGLLAANTIATLLSRGYRVRGLIRNRSRFPLPLHERLELVDGDITDPTGLRRAAEGVDGIIHCAAVTDQRLRCYDDYHRVNVTGTENVIEAALSCGVKKLVYVSTANTMGYGTRRHPGSEQQPMAAPFTQAWYARSKYEGEQRVRAAAGRLDVTIVNPTFVIGPFDGKPSSGIIVLIGYRKRVIFYPPGGKNFVNAADAAAGVVQALETGKNGEAYLLAGENLSYREFFRKLGHFTGTRAVLIPLPKPVLMTIGHAGDLLRKIGIRTAVTSTNMAILCIRNYYSNEKAVHELGVTFQSIEAGIAQAVSWFRERSMC